MRTFSLGLLRLAFLLPLVIFFQAEKRIPAVPVEKSACNGPCSFSMNSGFNSPTNEITAVGGIIDFYMVFFSSSTMNPGTVYNIATFGTPCAPTVNRFTTANYSGRTWQVELTPSGGFSASITSGTAVPAGTIVDLQGGVPQ